jgi:Flp pilus assembly protein TadD
VKPTYLPAVAGLARLDLAEKKPAEARARFEAAVAREPNNDLALLGLADILTVTKAPSKDIAAVLQRAITVKPQSVAAHVALINLQLQDKDTRAALATAQQALVSLPGEPRILDALGRAQMAAGETNQALDTFTRLAKAQPQSVAPLMRLAAVYNSRKEPERAIEVLLRAQKLAPTDAAIARDLVLGYLAAGKVDDARSRRRHCRRPLPRPQPGTCWRAISTRQASNGHRPSAPIAMP